jgi:hypothetical protein
LFGGRQLAVLRQTAPTLAGILTRQSIRMYRGGSGCSRQTRV